jgi:hypothetical protein
MIGIGTCPKMQNGFHVNDLNIAGIIVNPDIRNGHRRYIGFKKLNKSC